MVLKFDAKIAGVAQRNVLTYLDRDKMAAILRTTLPNAFSWMKTFYAYFTEICAQESNQQYGKIGSDNVLA